MSTLHSFGSLGQMIRRRRHQLGISQADLAYLAGLSAPWMHTIEADGLIRPLKLDTLVNLALILELPLSPLLGPAGYPEAIRHEGEQVEVELRPDKEIVRCGEIEIERTDLDFPFNTITAPLIWVDAEEAARRQETYRQELIDQGVPTMIAEMAALFVEWDRTAGIPGEQELACA